MKILAYKFDGIVFEDTFKAITLELFVTTGMIQTVIEKSQSKKWKIEKKGWRFLANKERNTAIMIMTAPAYEVQNVVESLGIKTDATKIDFYRLKFEKRSHNFKPLNFWVFNSKTKKSYLSSGTPFVVSKQATVGNHYNSHFVAKKIA